MRVDGLVSDEMDLGGVYFCAPRCALHVAERIRLGCFVHQDISSREDVSSAKTSSASGNAQLKDWIASIVWAVAAEI